MYGNAHPYRRLVYIIPTTETIHHSSKIFTLFLQLQHFLLNLFLRPVMANYRWPSKLSSVSASIEAEELRGDRPARLLARGRAPRRRSGCSVLQGGVLVQLGCSAEDADGAVVQYLSLVALSWAAGPVPAGPLLDGRRCSVAVDRVPPTEVCSPGGWAGSSGATS